MKQTPFFLTIVTALCLIHTAGNAQNKTTTAPTKASLSVVLVKPQTLALTKSIFANGSVAAWQEASISASVSGLRLVELNAQVGDTVRKGQVLAKFEQDTLLAEIAAIKAQLAEAQANSDEASANATRASALEKQGFYSPQAISQVTAQQKSAQARLDAAKANLDAQMLRLKHSVLYAPDNGVISARNATVGSVVAAGVELFRMNLQSRLEWRAEVTANELSQIVRGTAVTIDDGTLKTKGTVRQIAPNLDAQTRNAIVYVDLPLGATFKVGQFIRGEFVGAAKQAMTVPVSAVVMRDGFDYVFTVVGDKASQVKVKLGQRSGNTVEIVSGINANVAIVSTGSAFLTDGDTVKVVQP